MYQYALRHIEMHGREIPDSQNSAFNEQVADGLRIFCRDRDDADAHAHALTQIHQLIHCQNAFAAVIFLTYLFIDIERGHNVHAAVFKAAIRQKRLAELARVEGLGPDGDYRITPAIQTSTGESS